MRRAGLAAAAAAALAANPALADDARPPDDPWGDVEGHVRAGLRLLSGENEGRFPQDRSLDDGVRVFDVEARGGERAAPLGLTEWEVAAHGLGDANEDARLRLRKDDTFDISGGWMRDDFTYSATGDPFPYDTRRERGDLKVRVRPSRELTLRLDLDHTSRRGDAYTIGDTDRRDPNFPPPAGVDNDFVNVHRPLHQQADTATLGADWRTGDWRFSLAETARLAQNDDRRVYDVQPANLGGSGPVSEDLRRDVRGETWTTVAKAGVTVLDGTLDIDAIGSFSSAPVRTRYGGAAEGFDSSFDAQANQRGPYAATIGGRSSLDRERTDLRIDALWRAGDDVEVVVSAESDRTKDDAELRYVESRTYSTAGIADRAAETNRDARITDRGVRASAEVAWDVSDALRLRTGEEWYQQELQVPFSTRPGPELTDFSSTSWRTIAGADWKPVKGLDFSLLAKFGQNDEPHTTPSTETSNEISYRGRWKASETLFLTTTWRHKDFRHSDDLDAAARSDAESVAATWTPGDFTITPSVTWQTLDTRADTVFFTPLDNRVAFHTRDLIASLDVRWEITKTLRAHLTGTHAASHGDNAAVWDDASLGAEHDLSEKFTVGADLLLWRLHEQRDAADDYSVVGCEIYVTWKF